MTHSLKATLSNSRYTLCPLSLAFGTFGEAECRILKTLGEIDI